MKRLFIDFEYIYRGKVTLNTAFVDIVVKDKSCNNIIINKIGFKSAIYEISFAQLLDLVDSIQNEVIGIEESDDLGMSVVVNKNSDLVIKNNNFIDRLQNKVEKMAVDLDKAGKFSESEKKDVSTAFGLINKFLGKK